MLKEVFSNGTAAAAAAPTVYYSPTAAPLEAPADPPPADFDAELLDTEPIPARKVELKKSVALKPKGKTHTATMKRPLGLPHNFDVIMSQI
jgi:hypothetical protein